MAYSVTRLGKVELSSWKAYLVPITVWGITTSVIAERYFKGKMPKSVAICSIIRKTLFMILGALAGNVGRIIPGMWGNVFTIPSLGIYGWGLAQDMIAYFDGEMPLYQLILDNASDLLLMIVSGLASYTATK